MTIKILFDKEKLNDKFEAGWGISLLVQDVLFDTGENFKLLKHNMDVLGVKATDIKRIVISHNQWDHRSGLWELLSLNDQIKVYACHDFLKEFDSKIKNYDFKAVNDFEEISQNIYTTGPFKTLYKGATILEQVLVDRTKKGLSIISGCAHMGILEVVHRVKLLFPGEVINCLIGGFHLMDADSRLINYLVEQIRLNGVQTVGPSHCSGYEASEAFRKNYGKNFIEIKSGVSFEL
jgi:7,8-dihydropterin-6-yl-methyl-4-(beta-D-ribofuranosyl)aminobenzene 5'-phosphate synthase